MFNFSRKASIFRTALFTFFALASAVSDAALPQVSVPKCAVTDNSNSSARLDVMIKQSLAYYSVMGFDGAGLLEARLDAPAEYYLSAALRRALETKTAREMLPAKYLGELTRPTDTPSVVCTVPPKGAAREVLCTIGYIGDPSPSLLALLSPDGGDRWSCRAWVATQTSVRRALGANPSEEQEGWDFRAKALKANASLRDLPPANPYRLWAERNPCRWHNKAMLQAECRGTGLLESSPIPQRARGKDPVGSWRGAASALTVTKSGDQYKVVLESSKLVSGTFVGRYQNFKIDASVPVCGAISYDQASDTLLICGEELYRQ